VTANPHSTVAVSVIMPVFNAARYLTEAMESILEQTHCRMELIVVDDCSTDGSWEIVQRLAAQDGRVKAFRNPTNRGIVKTRNLGFARSNPDHRYLAIMDGDDVSMPHRLERQVAFLEEHPDHALVGGNTLIIDEMSRVVGSRRYPSRDREIRRVITRFNPIAQPTVMLRRSALERVGGYDERYPRCQDYDLWCRMAARYPIANLDEYTLKYRISSTQGKKVHLRDTLRFTLQIQRQWLFHPGFFHPLNVLTFGLEHVLLKLPEPLVMELFKMTTYRSGDSTAGEGAEK